MAEEIGEQAGEILAVAGELVQFAEGIAGGTLQNERGEGEQLAAGGEAKHGEDIAFLDSVAAKAD